MKDAVTQKQEIIEDYIYAMKQVKYRRDDVIMVHNGEDNVTGFGKVQHVHVIDDTGVRTDGWLAIYNAVLDSIGIAIVIHCVGEHANATNVDARNFFFDMDREERRKEMVKFLRSSITKFKWYYEDDFEDSLPY